MSSFIKRKRNGLLVALGLLVGVLIILVLVINRQTPQKTDEVIAAPLVRVIQTQLLPLRIEARGNGLARAANTWQAIANVPGRVIYRHPQLEDGVLQAAGTLLLELDPSRYHLAEAEALAKLASLAAEQKRLEVNATNAKQLLALEKEGLQLAERELARLQRLAKSGSVSHSRHDAEERTILVQRKTVQSLENEVELLPSSRQRLKAETEQAATRLEQTRQDLKDTRFIAPYDLRLGVIEAELHQYINAGKRLFQADGIASAEITAQIPLAKLRRLVKTPESFKEEKLGLDISDSIDFSGIDVEVKLVGGEGAFWPAKVVRVAKGLNPKTRAAQVVVEVTEPYRRASLPELPALQPDMYVQVKLSSKATKPRLIIPASALHQGEVYLVNEQQRLERRRVEVAFEQQDMVIISKGLTTGETLIIDDLSPAINGMLIQPLQDTASEQNLRRKAKGETL